MSWPRRGTKHESLGEDRAGRRAIRRGRSPRRRMARGEMVRDARPCTIDLRLQRRLAVQCGCGGQIPGFARDSNPLATLTSSAPAALSPRARPRSSRALRSVRCVEVKRGQAHAPPRWNSPGQGLAKPAPDPRGHCMRGSALPTPQDAVEASGRPSSNLAAFA